MIRQGSGRLSLLGRKARTQEQLHRLHDSRVGGRLARAFARLYQGRNLTGETGLEANHDVRVETHCTIRKLHEV